MKRIKRKVYFLLTFAIILVNLTGTPGFAVNNNDNMIHPDSQIKHINLNTINEDKIYIQDQSDYDDSKNQPYGPIFEYYWKITSKTIYNTKFGAWRDGPTGFGPGSLSINESQTINRNFTASISGEYPVGLGTIGASLGVDIGKTKSYGTSYTINLASGERKTIMFRPKINVYRIVQTRYKVNMYTGEMTPIDTKIAYVDVFNNWDYSWRYGY